MQRNCRSHRRRQLMMLFFQQELGWSVRGFWAEPKKLTDGVSGCQIVYGGTGSLHADLQTPMETPLCKNKEKGGVGEGLARGRSDAKVRLFF